MTTTRTNKDTTGTRAYKRAADIQKSLRKINTRIDDLETYCRHLCTVLTGVLGRGPIPMGSNYALLALLCGFSYADDDKVWTFLNWSYKEIVEGRMTTREQMIAEYEARMPQHLRGKLEMIVAALRDDEVFDEGVRLMFGPQKKKKKAKKAKTRSRKAQGRMRKS